MVPAGGRPPGELLPQVREGAVPEVMAEASDLHTELVGRGYALNELLELLHGFRGWNRTECISADTEDSD